VSRHQNTGKNHNLLIANKSLENIAKLGYLETTVTNEIRIHEDIKGTMNSGNVCYSSDQNLLPFRFLSKNLKIKTHKTIILPVIFYKCENLSLTPRE
jgi:hypothetical protein